MQASVDRRRGVMDSLSSEGSLSDMVLEFFEERESTQCRVRDHDGDAAVVDDADELDGQDSDKPVGNNKAFWETQYQLLQDALSRSSSSETRIHRDTEKLLGELRCEGAGCSCSNRSNGEWCRNCSMRSITERLREAGYNSALCRSKWPRSMDIPSGEHSYVDVMVESKSGKRSPIRVVIELSFRAEFEMARASEEYNNLVQCLPQVFVGKSERLKSVIKIMCGAAKQCMKDNKMHMAPWRKHKYMQSKWLGACERMSPPRLLLQAAASDRQRKQRASMLTFDLHCPAVEVV